MDELIQKLYAVKNDDCSAYQVDDAKGVFGKLIVKQSDTGGEAKKPAEGRSRYTADKFQAFRRREGRPESAQHHGSVDDCLWIEPCYDACGGDDLENWDINVFAFASCRLFCFEKRYSDPDDDNAANQ